MSPDIKERVIEIVEELQAIKNKYHIDNAILYRAATDESREEYFCKLFELVEDIYKQENPDG